jgi:hypothetical protein
MNQVLASNEHDILLTYPPLKNQKLESRLRNTSLQYQLDEREVYFKKLREEFENEVNAA